MSEKEQLGNRREWLQGLILKLFDAIDRQIFYDEEIDEILISIHNKFLRGEETVINEIDLGVSMDTLAIASAIYIFLTSALAWYA